MTLHKQLPVNQSMNWALLISNLWHKSAHMELQVSLVSQRALIFLSSGSNSEGAQKHAVSFKNTYFKKSSVWHVRLYFPKESEQCDVLIVGTNSAVPLSRNNPRLLGLLVLFQSSMCHWRDVTTISTSEQPKPSASQGRTRPFHWETF